MAVSETKLLPCPFCGGQPHVSARQDEDLTTHNIVVWTRVYCIECSIGFEMPPGYNREPITQWNTRALTAALSDQVAVPREPTPAMLLAADKALKVYLDSLPEADRTKLHRTAHHGVRLGSDLKHALRYKAMIAAAHPEPTGGNGEDVLGERG